MLSAHPGTHGLFLRLGRTRFADSLFERVARSIIGSLGSGKTDYHAIATASVYRPPVPGSPESRNLDVEYLSSLAGHPQGLGKIAQALKNLESLSPETRTGLLKTWLHAALVTSTSRDAFFLRRVAPPGLRPIDAVVAAFGGCGLRCRGCHYRADLDGRDANPLRLNHVIRELNRLDVYHVLLAGKGEPFHSERAREALFSVANRHPQIFFTVFTNGMEVTEKDLAKLEASANILPTVSIDGPAPVNDWRRGRGVHSRVVGLMREMRKRGIFFGFISTVFSQNVDHVTNPEFAEEMAELGCQVGFYSQFVPPPGGGFPDMALSPERRRRFSSEIRTLDETAPIPLIDIDGSEVRFGCRARRGATIYVDALTGGVSPCIRATLGPDRFNLFQHPEPGGLGLILGSQEFLAERRRLPESGTCIAFDRDP